MTVRNVCHLGVENYVSEFVLESDVAAEAAYPLSNVQNQHADHWAVIDMTGETSVTIQGTSSIARIVNSFCVWNHNLPRDATVQLLLYPDESYAGTPFDSGALDAHSIIPWGAFMPSDPWAGTFEDNSDLKRLFLLYFEQVAFKSFQVVIDAGTWVNTTVQIDKLWLGPSYAMDYGHSRSSSFGFKDSSEHMVKPGGGMETAPGVQTRTMNLDFDGMKDAEIMLVENLLTKAKKGGDLLVSVDPNNSRSRQFSRSGIFRRTNDASFTAQYYNWNSLGLALEEN